MKPIHFKVIAGLMLVTVLVGCAYRVTLKPLSFQSLPGWQQDDLAGFMEAFLLSCEKFQTRPQTELLHPTGVGGSYADWQAVCKTAKASSLTTASQRRLFIEHYFSPYHVSDNYGDSQGLFTGYFEASLEGSRERDEEYRYPIYQLPTGFTSGDDFYTRQEIDAGALDGKQLEILWVKDDVKLFFAHVQGSATVKMNDGSFVRVGYAGKTAHPYQAIGKYLHEHGHIEKENLNAESIQAWLYLNPEKRAEIFAYNPSYIFFRELSNQGGPIGGQGVALTAERSLAVDKTQIPYGVPMWLNTSLPLDETPYQRLMVAQDTGSAIQGVIRGDIFFGFGDEAAQKASYQQSEGSWYMLLPKGLADGQKR